MSSKILIFSSFEKSEKHKKQSLAENDSQWRTNPLFPFFADAEKFKIWTILSLAEPIIKFVSIIKGNLEYYFPSKLPLHDYFI